MPIPGATASNLTLLNVQGRMEGIYSATVSNSLGMAVSRNAQLQVDDGLVFNTFATLLDITNGWRYEASGLDLGAAWRFPGYDDSGWSNGFAMFGFEDPGVYPLPFLTPFSLRTSSNVFIITFYFRTTFSLPAPSSISGLLVQAFVDDGAVWYLNGREAARVRIAGNLPADGVTNSVLGVSQNPENNLATLVLPLTNAVAGENLLAVEVHQSSTTSTDVAFGMALSSYITMTNGPVLLLPVKQPGGGVEVTLQGISGRNYALDVSTNLSNWTSLTTWTNFTGSALYLDAAANLNGNRFYRGRLAP